MEENSEIPGIKTIIIDNVKYKTRLTKKYLARKPYKPLDLKSLLSFIPGTILKIHVTEGQKVKKGDKLLELEAMKMVNHVTAPFDGIVSKLHVKSGDMVPKNYLLIEIA
jgi:biotin carboxyl carrier protein